VYYGNGANLTGITIGSGSPYYIQNGTSQQTGASFNIDGTGTVGGTLSGNAVNSATSYNIGGLATLAIGSSADWNVFLGQYAGSHNHTGSGQFNVFAGYSAGWSNTTGNHSIYIGQSSGYQNTGGSYNTYVGDSTGYYNTSGSYNVFIGSAAGHSDTGSENVFVGAQAGAANLAANANTFLGNQAGYANNTGEHNSYLGYFAGGNNTGGSYNTFVGDQAGSGAGGSTSSNIYIGNAGANENNTIRIGTQGTNNGEQDATFIAGIYHATSASGIAVYVNSSGQLGTATSSRRFKEQIRDMGDSTNGLMKLRPVTFLYKPEYDKGPRTLQYGLIAEEVAEVYPDLVAYEEDGKPYTVKYQYLTTMLLNEMQKQYHRAEAQAEVIKTQQQEIDDLKAQLLLQNAAFQERLLRLESMVGTQTQTAANLPHQ
jgi:endosialidase-like protein